MKSLLRPFYFLITVIALTVTVTSCREKDHDHHEYSAIPDPVEFSPNIPVDVNPELQ